MCRGMPATSTFGPGKRETFRPCFPSADDTFELDALKPGDLLFWANTARRQSRTRCYAERAGFISAVKKEQSVGSCLVRAMGETYKGREQVGVSVFDFKVRPRETTEKRRTGSEFRRLCDEFQVCRGRLIAVIDPRRRPIDPPPSLGSNDLMVSQSDSSRFEI